MAPPKAEVLLLKHGGSGAQLLQALESVTGASRVALVSKSKNVEALAAWLEKVCGHPRQRGPARRKAEARPNGPVHGQARAGRAGALAPCPPVCLRAPTAGQAWAGSARVGRARPSRLSTWALSPSRASPAPQETSLGATMDMKLVKELADLVPVSDDMTRCAVAALERSWARH
jgi:hypothetical protein